MDKEDVVYIHNGILSSHNEEWNSAICNNVDVPRDYYLSEISQMEEDKYSHVITYMWKLKKWNIQICITKQKQIQEYKNKVVFSSGEREGRRGKIELWD